MRASYCLRCAKYLRPHNHQLTRSPARPNSLTETAAFGRVLRRSRRALLVKSITLMRQDLTADAPRFSAAPPDYSAPFAHPQWLAQAQLW